LREKNKYRPTDERLEVVLALASQLFALADEEDHLQALSLLLEIFEDCNLEDREQVHKLLLMLQKTIKKLLPIHPSSHAHQIAQGALRLIEMRPDQLDLKDKQV